MKSMLLIRHAKSSWNDPHEKDFDRPLNERGRRDAPVMAARLKEKLPVIDLFISSPANRALSTAISFARAYGLGSTDILQIPELYHAPPHVFYDVIAAIPDHLDTVAIFSHNGGITDFVNGLTETKVDVMPTCSIYGVKADITKWSSFYDASKNFWFFDYPKKL
ncbi:MAG: histidine phosphatase family protein [Chitinophagaceae bacterium]|nr:histidine phosphatase family protein [Chitinophagaceae bacterium]